MTKQARKNQRIVGLTSVAILLVMVVSFVASSLGMHASGNYSGISIFDGALNTNKENYYNSSVIYQLPSTVKNTDELSIIIKLNKETLLDIYNKKGDTGMEFGEFSVTDEANVHKEQILADKQAILASFDAVGISYKQGANYASVLSGFEVQIVAKDFVQLCNVLGNRGTAIVGDVYELEKTELVENPVNVKESGIFDTTLFPYDGTGMVVAVLDTGLDYYHTAFSVGNFTADRSKLGLTYEQVAALIGDTKASSIMAGLTADDVYLNEKVPYSFDYADYDADVFPINSDHGTHVAGIIAGKDDEIRGVAPNAQLVIMKTFSDVESSARTSWILSALEDCVVLGVDVINMSLGTSCGFSRETDKEQISGVYEKIREQGIAIVAAASNSFNSTYGSEKNGNLGLTSNPDSATVSSPGTYEGALSVASIQGVKTPYILFGETIIYYTESSNRVSEEKIFFDDLNLGEKETRQLEFVTVPGVGRSADYTGLDVTGKIVLVRRGSNTFEEKANVAQEKGAAGIIVYNNVSGDIKMNVGDTVIAVASISQDDGEMLAAAGSGYLTISRAQTSGPFMSDFSSWGPTPDLSIKPEITAHGGSIYSSVPGQSYDRISGTSMACPNLAGVVALLRQYVIENYGLNANRATAMVNQLLMSTADIILNVNGLPYSVRKQGAGLANLDAAASTTALILTYDGDGNEMSTSKIELGDDKNKTGVYTLKFSVMNFGSTTLTYDVGAYVMTEGVSETLTSHGDTTVTEDGYILSGATIAVNGSTENTLITVGAGQTKEVTVTITLSDADKKYLDDSFENGMYVEGFVTLDAADESVVDLSVPYLGFYGDWTQAPLFDLTYFDTNADELDNGIDPEDKTMADAYASRPVGGLSEDYVNYLGAYYFQQNPSAKVIAANPNFIALSNQDSTVNSLRFVWAGMLRNAERIVITITDDATGEVIFETIDYDVRKSYGDGGSIYPANVEIEFDAAEHNLKNNSTYTVRLEAFLDYGEDGGKDTNKNNVFEFPLTVDFEAPTVTGCEFYTEYDKSAKKNRLYAKIAVYDNHYAMAMQIGYVALETDQATGELGYVLKNFDKYLTPVYSTFNGVSYVTYELTDYIHEIRTNASHTNTFTVACYDYALNEATYEIALPSEYTDFYMAETETGLTLSPNQVYTLSALTYPGTEWPELLTYYSANEKVATVVNNKLVAIAPGKARIIAHDPSGKSLDAYFTLTVLAPGDAGYKRYDKPVADSFTITGFYVDKAYYQLNSDDRLIGATGDEMKFASPNSLRLTMYPSEAVTLRYKLDAYFPKNTTVKFESSNSNIVTVDQNGKITAKAEGYASISVRVLLDGKSTLYSKSITIEVKDPYITTGPSLTHYFGLGGVVNIPNSLAITEIGQFAFSNYDYVAKDPSEITEETPESTKVWFIGDNTVEEVIIPEGVEKIGPYAFANLTALKKVVLPSTLVSIDYGAFYGCTALRTVEGMENVKFINQGAFSGCSLSGVLNLEAGVAVADYAFYGNANLSGVVFSDKIQSIGAYAFADCNVLNTVTIGAEKVKLGKYAFANCRNLTDISVNASVVPTGIFSGCSTLKNVTLGKDVSTIGEFAFLGTAVENYTIAQGNTTFKPQANLPYILNAAGNEILLVSPTITTLTVTDSKITSIGAGALSGNTKLTTVNAPSITQVGDYAFAYCNKLESVTLGNLTKIGNYAFYSTAIKTAPSFAHLNSIGKYAFAESKLESVTIPSGTADNRFVIGEGAFAECKSLKTVTIGDYVTVGESAFLLENVYNYTTSSETIDGKKVYFFVYLSPLKNLTIGKNAILETNAFYGAAEVEKITLGEGAVIGDFAFYNNCMLKEVEGLSYATYIGKGAFAGDVMYLFTNAAYTTPIVNADGYYEYRYYASRLTEIDLSSATFIGEDAFASVITLEKVVLGAGLTELPARAFQNCPVLTDINLENIKSIGEEAFVYAAFDSIALDNIEYIGKYAFAYCEQLTHVTLGDKAVELAEGAFSNCGLLNSINLDKVTSVGDYALAYTSITHADLTSATYVGTQAFIKETVTDFTVVLSENLTDMGDNPFAMCRVAPFSNEVVVDVFNGKEYTEKVYTFDISDTIKVIDGSIYRVVPNGLEMITYAGISNRMTVAANTVRISAMAFAGSDIKEVVLPYTVYSIGHKAFYACNDLRVVTFSSYNAPVLEEEFDQMRYYSCDYIPATGDYEVTGNDGVDVVKQGLGIIPYYMWNVLSQPSTVFYGANFVDYIGEVDRKITMVRPTNGKNYDSFIFTQYFDTAVSGAAAADKVTLNAIDLIEQLPEKVSLKDKALVEAARAAYNQISTLEQQSLVTHLYAKLTAAEKRISDLEYLNQEKDPVAPPQDDVKTPLTTAQVWNIVLGILVGVMTIAAGTFAVLYFMPQIKVVLAKIQAKKAAKAEETSETETETEEKVEEAEPDAVEETDDGSEGA